MSSKGWDYSEVQWRVFLPHPGRVGKAEDSLGHFKDDSFEGIVNARRELKLFARGVRFALSYERKL